MNLSDSILQRFRQGPAPAAELTRLFGVSQPTVSRALAAEQRAGRVVKLGSTRGARYAMPRQVADTGSAWPVFRVDAAGTLHELGTLHALEPRHYYFETAATCLRDVTDAIPYFLQDQRPAGFLGRAIPASYPELALPQRVIDWTDEHYLAWMTRRGSDCVSDLIVGREAFDRLLRSLKSQRVVSLADRAASYPQLAAQALERGTPGSSAHGEHPKFTVATERGQGPVHVIVKFSPPDDTPAGQRWSDLLVSEHLAHVHLRAHGIAAAKSELLHANGQAFLEVERFDRAGAHGRIGVVSLLAVDSTLFGKLDSWSQAGARLVQQGLLSAADAQRMRLLEAFAMLTANTDRHFGNLALLDRYDGRFTLAPVYDMLPMLFAPQDGQVIERRFNPPDPTAETLALWPQARELARGYWQRLVADERLSPEFRDLCAAATDW
jgi:DNA-binding transcriptional ArsR family regulator